MNAPRPGGGWPAIAYTVSKALEIGPWRLWQKMRSKNACKTCALGMGGQKGGMVNEAGHFPEVCKKSLQAQVADMKGAIAVEFFENNSLADLEKLTPKQAEDAGRLTFPVALAPGESHFKPISWESALAAASQSLRQSPPTKAAFYSSGRSSNEAAYLLQLFARFYGCNNVMNCSFYCHQASGVGLKMAFGSGTATIELDDLDRCDLVILLGANPASNHPRLMTKLANLRKRGGKVIVVNPLIESGLEKFHVPSQVKSLFFGSEISSTYLQPHAGGDTALLIGLLKALSEKNCIDLLFLQKHTIGSEAVLQQARALTWDEIVAHSGVAQEEIVAAAEVISRSEAVIFAWAMGLTHHSSGVGNILALSNLALATGNVGKPGAGMLPIRGHSNVQGIGSVGVAPHLQDSVRQSLEKIYGKELPTEVGYDTYSMIEAAEQGKIKTLIALGGNLWGSNPNSAWAARAMQTVETTVFLSTKLNPGHFHGRAKGTTIILPVLARDEEEQSTTQESMFNFVRLSDGGVTNVAGQMRSEFSIICQLANDVLGNTPVDWNKLRNHDEVRRLIASTIPGWQDIEQIGTTGAEFTVKGRVFHQPSFPTESGKANMVRVDLPELPSPDALRLITLRSEGQFNTVVCEEYDLYRGIPHRFCILLSPEDVEKYKPKNGQKITVAGESGRMGNIEVRVGKIRAGTAAMYYPEANVLISGTVDPQSRTPAFKSAPIWLLS